MDSSWDNSAKAYYRENPGLADRYPTEAEFLRASSTWVARLKELPEKTPDALGTEGLEFTYNQRGGTNTYLSYRLPNRGGVLRFASQEGRVVGLSVE